jgi:hypothetical protein
MRCRFSMRAKREGVADGAAPDPPPPPPHRRQPPSSRPAPPSLRLSESFATPLDPVPPLRSSLAPFRMGRFLPRFATSSACPWQAAAAHRRRLRARNARSARPEADPRPAPPILQAGAAVSAGRGATTLRSSEAVDSMLRASLPLPRAMTTAAAAARKEAVWARVC